MAEQKTVQCANCQTSFWEAETVCPSCGTALAMGSTDQLVGGAIGFIEKRAGEHALQWGAVGLVAGVLLGILSRPSYPLAGQMPIGVVLSRGAGLTGMDLLFKSAAEDSFNHVLIVTIIGIVAGAGLGWYLGSRNASATSAGPVTISPRSSEGSPQDLTTQHAFCMKCGTRLPSVAAFCPSCGTKRESVVG
jgi:RNA polymerase subunit RPABC4/transcription elongation factor Spt4